MCIFAGEKYVGNQPLKNYVNWNLNVNHYQSVVAYLNIQYIPNLCETKIGGKVASFWA